MAVVGEAASVAGLIAIVGQALDGALTIYNFAKAYQEIVPQAHRVVKEVNDLRQVLCRIQDVASCAATSFEIKTFSGLYAAVSKCQTELFSIEQNTRSILGQRKRDAWHRLKTTARRDRFDSIHAILSAQRENLLLNMSTTSMEIDVGTGHGMKQMVESNASLHQDIAGIMAAVSIGGARSDAQYRALDARLAAIQRKLQSPIEKPNSAQSPRSSSRTTHACVRRVSARARQLELHGYGQPAIPKPAAIRQPLRVVSPALLVRQKKNALETKLVAFEMEEIAERTAKRREAIVAYLQGLRVLIWLLRKDNYMTTNGQRTLSTTRSTLTVEAGVAFHWVYDRYCDRVFGTCVHGTRRPRIRLLVAQQLGLRSLWESKAEKMSTEPKGSRNSQSLSGNARLCVGATYYSTLLRLLDNYVPNTARNMTLPRDLLEDTSRDLGHI